MNCSALSLARTATNGCVLNGTFLAASATNGTCVKTNQITTNTNTNNNNNNNCTSNNTIHTMTNNKIKPTSTTETAMATTAATGAGAGATVTAAVIATAPSSVSSAVPVSVSLAKAMSTEVNQTGKPTKRPELAAKIIKQSDIVCFDVDSTVIVEEGIDELAEFCGKGSEVARVTREAMGGAMTFQDALTIRLNIIRPTQQQIADFVNQRPSTLTPNVREFIAQLKADGKQVYLISGGFDCLIEPVANELGIPLTHMFANKLLFYCNGEYASFDTAQPTSKSGGKPEAISIIKQRHPSASITMIGDGATDLEAVPPANHFIGFGGNVVRAEVFQRAKYYVTDFKQLL